LVLVVAALAGFVLMQFQPLTVVLSAIASSCVIAAGAPLLGFAIQNMVDTFLATSIWLPVLCLAAFILADEPGEKPEETARDTASPNGARIHMALLALILLYFGGLVWTDVARYHLQRSVDLANHDQDQAALTEAQQAAWLDPAMPVNTLQLAYLSGKQADAASLYNAENGYRQVLVMEPIYGRQAANLAAVLWRLDKRAEAIQWLEKAISAENSSIYQFNLGCWHEQMGNSSAAALAYGRAVLLTPEMAGSAYWQQTDAGRQMLQSALNEAETKLSEGPATQRLTWRMAVATARQDWNGEREAARELLQLNPRACNALTAQVEAELQVGEKENAEKALAAALSADRTCAGGYLLHGLMAEMEGRDAEAIKDWQTALFLGDRRAGFFIGRAYERAGKDDEALKAYSHALPVITISNDVEVILYGRRLTFDILPPLERIGVERDGYLAALAAAGILEKKGRLDDARLVYESLLAQDPYLPEVKIRLAVLSKASE
jgi:tetratricopeptide (TPR) repeat protein